MCAWIAAVVVGGVVIIYGVTSAVFLRNPEWLWGKKKRTCARSLRCRHISHRGGAGESIENTMDAFRHAILVGSDHSCMLELDVHKTLDSKVVVIHDSHLLRLAGKDITIAETLYCDLPSLYRSQSLDFDKSHIVKAEGDVSPRVPLLEEVFAAFPDVAMNVDVKADDTELPGLVSDLITKFNREDLTVWGSFRESTIAELRLLNPNVPVFCSAKQVFKLAAAYQLGYLPFLRVNADVFEAPLMSKVPTGVTPTRMQRFMFFLIWFLVRGGLIKHLKARGIPTYAWVLNHEEEYERAFKLGVTGIMTDFPTKLADWLDRQHASSHPPSMKDKECNEEGGDNASGSLLAK